MVYYNAEIKMGFTDEKRCPSPVTVVDDSEWEKAAKYGIENVSFYDGKCIVSDDVHREWVDRSRREAYMNRSDPLFFKEQRGEIESGTWAREVAAIRDEIK